ncbi:SDR family oxidoreductase [Amycolatopsis methanolica]|uniref:SDR family oxidoreductase n=1 Tax=Amycolatopsis methanolica TaxID=1814 RepID=UPI00039F7575|nr:SDR family oxidoreductase [Amycolatopsis methanolica]
MDAERLAATTAQTPLRRLGEPSDIASIVAFLASAGGGWITGQTIHAGGGLFYPPNSLTTLRISS